MTSPDAAVGEPAASPAQTTVVEPRVAACPWTPLRTGALAARLLVGALFLVSAAGKIADPARFLKEIRAYELAPTALTNTMANYLPWLELFCGGFLVLCLMRREARWLLLAMLVVFTAAKAIVFLQGKPIECGCGGSFEFLKVIYNNPQGILTNIVLISLLLVDAAWQRRSERRKLAAAT